MRIIDPTPPINLNPYAKELLNKLAGHSEAAEIVLGGGVALSHYFEYRGTVDIGAWWRESATAATRNLIQKLMKDLATEHQCSFRLRSWGDTESYELLQAGRKIFSFQVSVRTRYMDAPMAAKWSPVMIETLRDNVASKMTALVERGAPRDLRDIYELCIREISNPTECWHLWNDKNPERAVHEGR